MEDDDMHDDETELEKEFTTLVGSVTKQIRAKVDEARVALNEAISLSETYGVPFRAGLSPLAQGYIPKSFAQGKFRLLDKEFIRDISGVYDEYNEPGWQFSAVCY